MLVGRLGFEAGMLSCLCWSKNEDTLNVKLNPPGGGSESLLMSESLRFNRFIQTADSLISVAQRRKTILWTLELFSLAKYSETDDLVSKM